MRTNDGAGARFAQELASPIGSHPGDVLLTEQRLFKYRQVLARRCDNPAVVLEDCNDPHNATAVLRSCDAFGLQRVHVVTTRNAFKVNRRISQGTHRYIDLRVHEHIDQAYAALRADGYRIFASELGRARVHDLGEVAQARAAGPIAVVFGSESQGISPAAAAGADAFFLIPMLGFTESLNLSVSVAVTLYALRQEALLADAAGDLSPARQTALYEQWIRSLRGTALDRVLAAHDPRACSASGPRDEELDVYGSGEAAAGASS